MKRLTILRYLTSRRLVSVEKQLSFQFDDKGLVVRGTVWARTTPPGKVFVGLWQAIDILHMRLTLSGVGVVVS